MAPLHEISEKVDLLFKNFRKKDGTEFTYQEVAEGTDNAISGVAVWKIRSGKVKSPSYRVLEAIAGFFGVPVGYFSSKEPVSEKHVQNLKLAQELRDAGVAQIALRVSDLDETAKQDVLAMIEYVRRAQGLPGAGGGDEKAQI
jgi:transcriptional regulator with XRE-family HTH domain